MWYQEQGCTHCRDFESSRGFSSQSPITTGFFQNICFTDSVYKIEYLYNHNYWHLPPEKEETLQERLDRLKPNKYVGFVAVSFLIGWCVCVLVVLPMILGILYKLHTADQKKKSNLANARKVPNVSMDFDNVAV